ncbi:MAG: carboxypeptidase regulatory-like domain-containing protein [Planctomycetota bacterium]
MSSLFPAVFTVALLPCLEDVSGVVVDAASQPIEGVTILAVPDSGSLLERFGGDPLEDPILADGTVRATSSESGTFVLRGVEPRQAYSLVLDHPKYVRSVELRWQATVDDLGTMTLHSGLAIVGQVESASGEPVAGAEIRIARQPQRRRMGGGPLLPPRKTRSAEDGSFRLEGLEKELHRVRVRAEGYLDATIENLLPEDGPPETTRTVTLARGRTLTGTVTGPSGQPLADATVTIQPKTRRGTNPEVERSTSTDAEGRYTLETIGWETTLVIASHDRFAQSINSVDTREDRTVDLSLGLPGTVTGRVVDSQSKGPVSSATLMFVPIDDARGRDHSRRMRTVTLDDAGGHFEVAGLDPGRFLIAIRRAELFEAGPILEVAAGENSPQPIEAMALIPLSGRVVSQEGKPVEGATVRVKVGRVPDFRSPLPTEVVTKSMISPPEWTAESGADGQWRLDGVDHGELEIFAFHQDAGRSRSVEKKVAAGDRVDGLELTLIPRGSLDARLMLDGQPAPAEVRVEINGPLGQGAEVHRSLTDENGSVRFRDLRPGEWAIFVASDTGGLLGAIQNKVRFTKKGEDWSTAGLETQVARATVSANETVELELAWDPPRIRVTAMAGGEPAEGLGIVVVDPRSGDALAEVAISKDGTYTLRTEPGSWIVVAWVPGHPFALRAECETAALSAASLSLELPSLDLEVSWKATGSPIELATVSLELLEIASIPEPPHRWIWLTERSEAPFPFDPRVIEAKSTQYRSLLPGRYRVTLESPGRSKLTREITLESKDETLELEWR